MPEARRPRLLALLLLLLLPAPAGFPAEAPHPLDAAAGKALFERQWVAAPASTAASDGLGPLFNARSCASCHPRGGSSAQAEHRILRLNDPVYGRQLQTLALAGFQPEAQLVLRDTAVPDLSAGTAPEAGLLRPLPDAVQLSHGALAPAWSLRQPPDLRAVAVIEAVDESVIRALADPDDADGNGISGRLALLPDGSLGRFGWKAESASLEAQLALAFSLDLGLGSAWYPSPHGDCTEQQRQCRSGVDGSVTGEAPYELEAAVIPLVATWLRSLTGSGLPGDAAGLALFTDTGCAACHQPLPGAQPLFSDLLLHDLGPGLFDSLPLPHAAAGEWRTAPLVGLGSRERFLHDGRARSLDEAVRWHGGEAAGARAAWLSLPKAEREALERFLKQL